MANGLNRDFDGHEQVSSRCDNLLITGTYPRNCTASAARQANDDTGSDSSIGGQSKYRDAGTLNKDLTGLFTGRQSESTAFCIIILDERESAERQPPAPRHLLLHCT